MREWTWIFIGAAALFGAPAAAQTTPAGTDQAPIVVEGRRDRDVEIRALVDALTPAPANGHISRFEHSACPAVVGLAPAQRAVVAARMRAVGEAAGVPDGFAHCRPNVVVIVTSDKRADGRAARAALPGLSRRALRREITSLAQSADPTALWHLTGLVNADGRQLFATGGNVVVNRTTRGNYRIADQAHHEFTGSVLVVQVSALAGLTTTQLADYAAMRTFTGADPARLPNSRLPTILTIVDAPMNSEVPITLTSWDLAFLQSFYASEVNIHAPGQRGEIQAGMRRALDHPDQP